jgi:hypothetical protein
VVVAGDGGGGRWGWSVVGRWGRITKWKRWSNGVLRVCVCVVKERKKIIKRKS